MLAANEPEPDGPVIDLTEPQDDFVHAEEQFPAMVAGFGAGKSHAAIWRAIRLKLLYPTCNVAYYLPTYDLVARMLYPRIAQELERIGVPYKINRNDNTVEIPGSGLIIARTMDNPARIVAYEVADSICDELDTLPTDKARDVWQKVLARNRQKKPDRSLNTVGVATTPEGFRFCYDRWERNPRQGYRLIRASTRSNAKNLPPGYIESLERDYPANLLLAYLEGHFVNLTSGSVYAEFDRRLNGSAETIKPSEPLHIGMDFNVGKMAAVVHVLRDTNPHAVDEIHGVLDTPAMIAAIKARYEGHAVLVYPDASGNNRKSNNASESDLALLRAARFQVLVNPSNPAVKDRVLAVNQLIHDKAEVEKLGVKTLEDRRRYRVNTDKCPVLTECLEKQAYDKNGEPDKSGDLDHPNDAAGYFIAYRWPVASRDMLRVAIGGL